jgi:hypothetical protein
MIGRKIMKSFKIKALAIAVLGLAGMGSAMAACTNSTPFAAWSSWNGTTNTGAQFGGATTATTGLNSTSCGMAATTTANPGSNGAQAVVFDNSPQSEQTYRFRFYIDPTAVKTSLSSFNSTYIFQASSASNHGTTAATNRLVGFQMVGDGTNAILKPFAACTTAGTGATKNGNLCQGGQVTVPSSTTGTRVEGQLIIGAAGTGVLNVWVGTNVGTPDVVVNVDNAAWGSASSDGVKQALMGILHTTQGYRVANVNKNVVFDEFDSRRQTAIGP